VGQVSAPILIIKPPKTDFLYIHNMNRDKGKPNFMCAVNIRIAIFSVDFYIPA